MAGGTKRERPNVKQKIHIATICRIFPLHIVTHESIRFDMHSAHGRVAIFAVEPVPLFSNYSPIKRDNSVAFIP